MTETLKKRPIQEENMGQYLQEIRSIPRLTGEEELALAKGCAQGDPEAIRTLVNANLRLVTSIARQYAGRGVPLLDLIQEGSIGLLAAARKFDYTLDVRFSTYATKWIRQGVVRCIQNHAELIRVPAHTAEKIRRVDLARQALLRETGQEPAPDRIAQACGMPEQKVRQLLQLQLQTVSLDAPAGEDGSLGVALEDLLAPQPQQELVRQELQEILANLLSRLDARQQQVLRMHFGIDREACSLEEIGQHLGISKERVRQVEKQAMEKLKKLGADIGLEDFLE